jgi:hypothetical protein
MGELYHLLGVRPRRKRQNRRLKLEVSASVDPTAHAQAETEPLTIEFDLLTLVRLRAIKRLLSWHSSSHRTRSKVADEGLIIRQIKKETLRAASNVASAPIQSSVILTPVRARATRRLQIIKLVTRRTKVLLSVKSARNNFS